jgi:hypothetical protein
MRNDLSSTFARRKHLAFAIVGVAALSACVPEGANVLQTAQFSPTKEEQAELIAFGHASAIARGCSGDVWLNELAAQRNLQPIADRAKAAGVRAQYETATLMGMTRTQAQEIGAKYEASRGIVPRERETWCAAGSYEVANKTRIGQYLIDAGKYAKQ